MSASSSARRRFVFAFSILILFCLFGQIQAGSAQRPQPEGLRRGFSLGPEIHDLSVQNRAPAFTTDQPASPAAPANIYLPNTRLVLNSLRSLSSYDLYMKAVENDYASFFFSFASHEVQPDLNRGANKVVFVSNRDTVYAIYTINVDGSNLTQLTFYSANSDSPVWSPDGSKIAYQTYKDGQWEVYVMNADGSNNTRLTNSPGGYSGEPTWSPDGTKIAYTAYVNSQWRIWVMNADGSNPVQISQQPYSANPLWSPDGEKIAYNCISQPGGAQEVRFMKPDGSGDTYVFSSGSIYADVLLGSWSPDMQNLLYTQVTYIVDNGTWYWTNAKIYFKGIDGVGEYFNLGYQGYDWYPDWESLDTQAPQASLDPLPPVSPGPFTVSWAASDQGVAGLREVQVQVRQDEASPWTDWIRTSASSAVYPGLGGHTYYFRIRAVDNVFNASPWSSAPIQTSVESEPPTSKLDPLPRYSPGAFTLTWSGQDFGGSGILHYLFEYKSSLSDPNWVTYPAITDTHYTFGGPYGFTYYMRLRAVDKAGNIQDWHNPQGYDTMTTVVTFVAQGLVIDQMGNPLPEVKVDIQPTPMITELVTQEDGSFLAPIVAYPFGDVTANWSKPGYGALPPAYYSYVNSGSANQLVILPPAENLIANPGLELTQALTAPWQTGGVSSPQLSATPLTGKKSALIGSLNTFNFIPLGEANDHNNQIVTSDNQALVDSAGVLHVVWTAKTYNDLYYAQQKPGEAWSVPLKIFDTTPDYSYIQDLKINAAPDGAILVTWLGESGFTAMRRSPKGLWSNASPAPGTIRVHNLNPMVDSQGILHLIYYTQQNTFHIQLNPNGIWSAPEKLREVGSPGLIDATMVVDSQGYAFAGWVNTLSRDYELVVRDDQGVWGAFQAIHHWDYNCIPFQTDMFVNAQDDLDIFWKINSSCLNGDVPAPALTHLRRSSVGVWSSQQIVIPSILDPQQIQVQQGLDGSLHVAWGTNNQASLQDIRYRAMSPQGVWGAEEIASNGKLYGNPPPQLALDAAGRVHMLTFEKRSNVFGSYYMIRTDSGWQDYGLITTAGRTVNPYVYRFAVDQSGSVTALAVMPNPELPAQTPWLYAGRLAIPQTDGSSYLQQSVQIPAGMEKPVLSFAYLLQNATPANGARLEVFAIQNEITSTLIFSTAQNTPVWTHQALDLSPFRGQQVTLRFGMPLKKGLLEPLLYLDDVSLGAAPPNLWAASALKTAQPNGQVVYALSYGNLNSASAFGAVLTHTLPADLTLISASAAYSQTGSTLTFNLGDLPGKLNAVIYITATLPSRVKPGANLTGSLGISSQTAEPEQANNHAATRIYVGRLVLLPVIRR